MGGTECKDPNDPWWLQLLEKANSYVFAVTQVRDREVGGSNPLEKLLTFAANSDSLCAPRIDWLVLRAAIRAFSQCQLNRINKL